jgi:hypothetical protein
MPTFVYKARNAAGEQVSGTLLAESALAAARVLDERSLLPVEVEEQKAQQRSLFTGRARKVSLSKVGQMYEQLADLLRAGVPILRALEVLSQQSSSAALARVLREVRDDVSGGEALADAMRAHPHAFPELHAAMVRAGEKGGFLEDVLARLSEFVARQDALKNKFIGALIYPRCCCRAIGAVSIHMAFIVANSRRAEQPGSAVAHADCLRGQRSAPRLRTLGRGGGRGHRRRHHRIFQERGGAHALVARAVEAAGVRQNLHDGGDLPLLPRVRHDAGERHPNPAVTEDLEGFDRQHGAGGGD